MLGQRLLAWLLYAYEHRKTGNHATGIESPFGYALSQYQKLMPTSEYMELAKHPPGELRSWLLNSPYGVCGHPKSAQRILKRLEENGFLELLNDLCEKHDD